MKTTTFIKIEKKTRRILVRAPGSWNFAVSARRLGGRHLEHKLYDDELIEWIFEGVHLDAVHSLCKSVYFPEGEAEGHVFTGRIRHSEDCDFTAWGRDELPGVISFLDCGLAWPRWDGSSRPKLDLGTLIEKGQTQVNGEPGNWTKISVDEGTVILVPGLALVTVEQIITRSSSESDKFTEILIEYKGKQTLPIDEHQRLGEENEQPLRDAA